MPLHEPFRISNGEVSVKDAILVEVTAQDGSVGWGEASPMGGAFYSQETPESTWEILRSKLVPNLLAYPDLDPSRYFERLEEFPGEPFAKAGIEGALWDLAANQQQIRGSRTDSKYGIEGEWGLNHKLITVIPSATGLGPS